MCFNVVTLSAPAVSEDAPSYTTDCVQLNGTLSLNVTYVSSDEKVTLDCLKPTVGHPFRGF